MDILGLSYDIDAAACLVRDGVPLAAAAEERFTRVKHDRSYPARAAEFCLAEGNTRMEELDWVALGWNPTIHLQPLLWRRSSRIRHPGEYLSAVPNLLIQELPDRPRGSVTEQIHHFEGADRPLRVAYVDHHLSHAAWAYVSPFERCAVLTVDGFGERTTTSQVLCEGRQLQTLRRIERPHSLGSLYAAVTQHLGFRANCDEGIVMSLAALGDPARFGDLSELLRFRDDGSFELDLAYFAFFQEDTSRVSPRFVERFGPPRDWRDPLEDRHRDLAASLQVAFEAAYLRLARDLHQRTGCDDLVVVGGAALNCVANGRILAETPFERMFIPPAAGDDGAATGAALYLTHGHLGEPRTGHVFTSAALGPGCDDDEIRALLELGRRDVAWVADPPRAAAELLAAGLVLGWYQGRAEFGPRALGQRSILADPRTGATRDHINASIKFRQPYRPLAPSVLAERCGELFDQAGPSPFMLRAFGARAGWIDRLRAAVHVDGSARVQTVDAATQPAYHSLIQHFAERTGVPAVVNTSLNVRGRPIANTPEDALACFDSTAMDGLVMGSAVLVKGDRRCRDAVSALARSEP
jgi:carbamoyltransferase